MCTFKAAESKRLTETKLIFNMCITNLKYEGGDQWNLQYDFEVTDFFWTENTVRIHAGRKFYIWG